MDEKELIALMSKLTADDEDIDAVVSGFLFSLSNEDLRHTVNTINNEDLRLILKSYYTQKMINDFT